MLSFLSELIEKGSQRPVTVVHADRSLDTWPLREELTELVNKLPNARLISFIEGEGGDFAGRVDVSSWTCPPTLTFTSAARCPSCRAYAPHWWRQTSPARTSTTRSSAPTSGCSTTRLAKRKNPVSRLVR